jgi:hypothetical protein
VIFARAGPPVFLPKRPISGPFLPVKLLRDVQVVVHRELAMLLKTQVYYKIAPGASNWTRPRFDAFLDQLIFK